MSRKTRPSRKALGISALVAAFFCASCGSGLSPAPRTKNSASAQATALYVASFSPASGTLVAAPTSITVTFNISSLNETTALAVSNYNITCDGNTYIAADSVTRTAGAFDSVITLPAITGLASGTVCTFIVSTNVKDSSGNRLGGSNTASYTIQ